MSVFKDLTSTANETSIQDADTIFAILGFWFGRDEVLQLHKASFSYYDDLWRKKWFAKSAQQVLMDKELSENYTELIEDMKLGNRDYWRNTPYGSMASIVVLDQFTRNVYRGTKNAWSGDQKALEICLEGINNGLYKKLPFIMRAQYLLPLLHSENLTLQEQSKKLYNELLDDVIINSPVTKMMFQRFVKISEVHYNSVLVFGRFPERNSYLNRKTTFEEQVYLDNTQVMRDEY